MTRKHYECKHLALRFYPKEHPSGSIVLLELRVEGPGPHAAIGLHEEAKSCQWGIAHNSIARPFLREDTSGPKALRNRRELLELEFPISHKNQQQHTSHHKPDLHQPVRCGGVSLCMR